MALTLTKVGPALLILQHDVRKGFHQLLTNVGTVLLILQHDERKGGTNSN